MSGNSETRAGPPLGHIRGYHGLHLLRQKLRSRVVVALECRGEQLSVRELAQRLVADGAGLIRLGYSGLTTRRMVDQTAQIVWACRGMRAPCLVEGRADVALAVMADGVHLGPADMPVALARRLMGPAATIGVTCRSVADAREAQREGASYVALDDIFTGTPEEVGERLALIPVLAEQAGLPVCVGGNVSLDHVALLRRSPAHLIVVDAALSVASEAHAATRRLVAALSGPWAVVTEAPHSPEVCSPQPSL